MKTLKYSLILFGMVLFGCAGDFLERAPISNMNEVDFYKTEKDLTTGMWSAYS